jgi:ubiquinone/menaquinone biosynthesis C-methylase UbiE
MNALNRFNWIAPRYDQLVGLMFGGTLHRAQLHFISAIGPRDSVLILGGGSGKFLNDLLAIRPMIAVTYIEASSEMIRLTRKTLHPKKNVTLIHGTENDIPEGPYDVVITNFFLDLFTNTGVEKLIKMVLEKLDVNGKWLVTDFENTKKISHRILLSLMYFFFRASGSISVKRLPEWFQLFMSAGLESRAEKTFKDGFVSARIFVRKKINESRVRCRSSEPIRPFPPSA